VHDPRVAGQPVGRRHRDLGAVAQIDHTCDAHLAENRDVLIEEPAQRARADQQVLPYPPPARADDPAQLAAVRRADKAPSLIRHPGLPEQSPPADRVPHVTIAAVRTHRLSAPLHTPFVTALRRATTVETLAVEIVDEDGRSGFGEAPQVWQVTGASIAGAEACVHEVMGPTLTGRDPDDLVARCAEVRRAVAGNDAAKAAVDTALHDLAARRLGVPLVRLLGGTALRVPTDVTLSAGDAYGLAAAAKERISAGFSVLKVKVGTDPAGDLARVSAIRAAIGAGPRIRLDANQGWTPREAVRIICGMEDAGLDVELVEQPVPGWDIEGLAWVSDRVHTPVLADEAVFGVRDLVEVIRRRAADMVNVKLAKCGGLMPARTLLGLAAAHEMGTIVGSMMESQIGLGAAASLVAAHGTTATSDLDAAWWLAWTPVQGGIRYEGANVVLPDTPGLGVTGLRSG
jgi:L-alanine-DL-glutamate epimerase-like enolase superfamily enzyme